MQSSTGVSGATWSDDERGKSEPNISALYSISTFFSVSLDDLLKDDIEFKGKIVHLNEKTDTSQKGQIVHQNVHSSVHPISKKIEKFGDFTITIVAEEQAKYGAITPVIPVTDLSVAAGMGIYNDSNIEVTDVIQLPKSFIKVGHTYLAPRIKGPSMSPTLFDGGYVICRLLDRGEWAKMPDEHIFVVIDNESKAYLKRVKNRFKKGFIVLRSDSPDQASYPSFNLMHNEITAIWYVEWYLSAKMPNVHDQFYSRLQSLEDRLDEIQGKAPKM